MKYKMSVYVTLAFLLGANLAYASGVATVAGVAIEDSRSSDTTILSETGIMVMDTEGNCWVISADNHVDDCTSEQAKQINRITTQAVSPKMLSETIPGDVAILAEEGKCVVVSKSEGSVDNCTEEQAFALQVLSESFNRFFPFSSFRRKLPLDNFSFGVFAIVLGGLGFVVLPKWMPLVRLSRVGRVLGGVLALMGATITLHSILVGNHWSDICNLEEHAKSLILTLNGEDLSPLEQIERLQSAYLKDSTMCVPSAKTLQELSQKVATADGFSPYFP